MRGRARVLLNSNLHFFSSLPEALTKSGGARGDLNRQQNESRQGKGQGEGKG